jgi:hypothetical protein
MHKNATKCNETLSKWCKNKHRASKIIDTFETYQGQKFLALQNSAKSFTKCCGATFCKGAGNSGGPEIPKFLALKNSAKSFTKGCGAAFWKGAENSEKSEFSALRIFAKSFSQAVVQPSVKGRNFWPEFSK